MASRPDTPALPRRRQSIIAGWPSNTISRDQYERFIVLEAKVGAVAAMQAPASLNFTAAEMACLRVHLHALRSAYGRK